MKENAMYKSLAIYFAGLAVIVSAWGAAHNWVTQPYITPVEWFLLLGLIGKSVIDWFNKNPVDAFRQDSAFKNGNGGKQ